MTDYHKALAAAREALTKLREHDGGTRYNGDDDEVGERACCRVASWKPHDSDCPHAVAVAEFGSLLAALDAARGEAVAWRWPRGGWADGTPWPEDLEAMRKVGAVPQFAYTAPPAALAVPEVAQHSTQDCYEHFLAYSGLEDSPWIKYAYFHGADVGLDRPSKPAPVAPAAAVPEGFAALVDAADIAYDRSAEGVAYVEFYRCEPVEKLLAACRALLAAANKENTNE